jgi:hypothetical protein
MSKQTEDPVAQTASGFALGQEETVNQKLTREAELIYQKVWSVRTRNGDLPLSLPRHYVVELMVGFTLHIWQQYQSLMRGYDDYVNCHVHPIQVPAVEASEGQFIKNLTAQCLGSDQVDFSKSSSEAVKTLVNAYCRLAKERHPGAIKPGVFL